MGSACAECGWHRSLGWVLGLCKCRAGAGHKGANMGSCLSASECQRDKLLQGPSNQMSKRNTPFLPYIGFGQGILS